MKKVKSTHQHSPQSAVDHLLLVFVVLSALTGFLLDGAAYATSHDAWLWAHIGVALVFTTLAGIHFWQHWGWFRTLPKRLGARKKDSLFLLVALIALLISGVVVATHKTHVSGFTHCLTGISCLGVSLYHFYVRHVRGKRRQ